MTKSWQRQFGGPSLPHGWCRKYDRQGQLEIEEAYRDGMLHGVFRQYRGGRKIEEGQHEQGLKEGIWSEGTEFSGRRGAMHMGRRQGEWVSWQDGEESRVTFNDGRVVAVRGIPVDRTFEKQFPILTDGEGSDSFRILVDYYAHLDYSTTLLETVESMESLLRHLSSSATRSMVRFSSTNRGAT